MHCKDTEVLLSAAIDGELEQETLQALEAHLASCDSCRRLQAELQQVAAQVQELPDVQKADEALDRFEGHVFARLERGTAWILLSVSAMLLLGCGAFYLVRDFLLSPQVPLVLRLGVGLGLVGMVVLVVSVARQRLFAHKHDTYKGVQR